MTEKATEKNYSFEEEDLIWKADLEGVNSAQLIIRLTRDTSREMRPREMRHTNWIHCRIVLKELGKDSWNG